MIIHELSDPPEPTLADALAAFEAQFVYPLGPGRSFRISHGADYPRFFRAMGEARCFVADIDGRVVGTLGVSLRRLTTDDGSTRDAAYIGDLKVAPDARGGRVLHRLSRAALTWARPRATCAFAVVMDGTAALPTDYTGRAGIPGFQRLGALQIGRLPAVNEAPDRPTTTPGTAEGDALYERLCRGRTFAAAGDPALRSELFPEWIVAGDGDACGRLEDTARAKRLLATGDDGAGVELRSAHLACFAWRTPAAAVAVLNAARRRAAELGFPAVFVSVDAGDAAVLTDAAGDSPVTLAGATVYGAFVPPGLRWSISSSEV